MRLSKISGLVAAYLFNLDGQEFPDPASNYQPEGVFGPSEVIDHYHWNAKEKNWHGIPLSHYIIYELHVGTYTNRRYFYCNHSYFR